MMPQSANAKAIRGSSHVHTTITTIHSNQVVVKEVRANCTNLDYLRLKREAEVLSSIQYERFPKVLDQFENAKCFGVIEEYLAGQRLGEWMSSVKPSKKQRIQVFIQILDIVDVLHQNGFLPLGVCLEDFLVHNNKVYLIDFKDCLPIGSLPPLIDTNIELPPEALMAKPLDIRSDQIALANIYERFIGHSLWVNKAKATRVQRRFSNLMTWKKALQITLHSNQIIFVLSSGILLILIFVIALNDYSFQEKTYLQQSLSSKQENQITSAQDVGNESFRSSPSITIQSAENSKQQENLCLQIYEKIAKNPEQILDLNTWTSYAKQALEQTYLPLAGYLLDHIPPGASQTSFEFQLYEFELSVFCQKDHVVSLSWLFLNLPDQPEWPDLFLQILECLLVNQIEVDQAVFEELIQQLENQLPLSNELCKSLMNYLLFLQSRQEIIWKIPDSVANELQVHASQLYGMLIKTQIE